MSWPSLKHRGGPKVVVTSTGVVAPVVGKHGDQYEVATPCENTATVSRDGLARTFVAAHVVLDPGHGGSGERGAIGPNGLTEASVNLAIAQEAKRLLETRGAKVALTRTDDYRVTLLQRARIAKKLHPLAFVSIHHNASPDGPWPRPGSETYFQIANPKSKRLAGLLWEEEVAAFSKFSASWVASRDAGAKYRTNSRGGDYYGVLRYAAGLPAVLSEAAFLSNRSEAKLLASPTFRRAEATAIVNALVRFVTTDDQGSGFTTPYPRTAPAGPGGGTEGCVDPKL